MKNFRTKIVFYDGRRFFVEESTKIVESRDIEMAREMVPPGCYGFTFCDVSFELATTESGETIEVNHERCNYSPTYFMPGAQIWTVDDVRAMGKDQRILLSNMEGNGYKRVVRTVTGNVIPMEDQDVVLEPR